MAAVCCRDVCTCMQWQALVLILPLALKIEHVKTNRYVGSRTSSAHLRHCLAAGHLGEARAQLRIRGHVYFCKRNPFL